MLRKISLALFIFIYQMLSLCAQDSFDYLQSRDTIFVYDTLFVVDTIRIARSPFDFKKLEEIPARDLSYIEVQNAASDEKLLIFSNGQTATLLDSDIKSVNNNSKSKNSKEMKKIGFLGVVLFAFQNMVLAQNDIGVYLGGSSYNLTVLNEDNTSFAPGFQLGISYLKPIAKKKLFVNTRLNYSYLSSTRLSGIDSISMTNVEITSLPSGGTSGTTTTQTLTSTTSVIPGQTTHNSHIFSLQFILGLYGKGFRPFVGIEPYYKDEMFWASPEQGNSSFRSGYGRGNIGAGALLGFQIPISKRWLITTSYHRQFTSDKNIVSGFSLRVPGEGTSVQFQRFEMSVRYRLFNGRVYSSYD